MLIHKCILGAGFAAQFGWQGGQASASMPHRRCSRVAIGCQHLFAQGCRRSIAPFAAQLVQGSTDAPGRACSQRRPPVATHSARVASVDTPLVGRSRQPHTLGARVQAATHGSGSTLPRATSQLQRGQPSVGQRPHRWQQTRARHACVIVCSRGVNVALPVVGSLIAFSSGARSGFYFGMLVSWLRLSQRGDTNDASADRLGVGHESLLASPHWSSALLPALGRAFMRHQSIAASAHVVSR